MTPRQLESYLNKIFQKKPKHTTFIWGDHGIAKSSLVKSVAKENGYRVIDFRVAQVESIDVAGMYYPTEVNGETAIRNLAPTYYIDMTESALANNGESKICLFFDEINMARRETMNACFEMVLDRKVKGKPMPEDVIIICAGNPETDDYDTTPMSESLKDRLIHVYLSAHKDDFVSWASVNGVRSDIIAFANSGHMEFQDSGFRAKLKPSPRSLARLSDMLNLEFNSAIEEEIILGILGIELGIQFIKNRVVPEKTFTAEEMLSFTETSELFTKFKLYANPENTRLDLLSASLDNFINYIFNNNISLPASQVDSIGLFLMALPSELFYKFWKTIDVSYEQIYANTNTIESITKPMFKGRLSAVKLRLDSLDVPPEVIVA